jgi:hypothetical protein
MRNDGSNIFYHLIFFLTRFGEANLGGLGLTSGALVRGDRLKLG